jgi:hypothetical protein
MATQIPVYTLQDIAGDLIDFQLVEQDFNGMEFINDGQTILLIYSENDPNSGARDIWIKGVEAMDGGGDETIIISCGDDDYECLTVAYGFKRRNFNTAEKIEIVPQAGSAAKLRFACVRVLSPINTGKRPLAVENMIINNGNNGLEENGSILIPNDGKTLIFTLGKTGTPKLEITGIRSSFDSGRFPEAIADDSGNYGVFGLFPVNVFGENILVSNTSASPSETKLAYASLSARGSIEPIGEIVVVPPAPIVIVPGVDEAWANTTGGVFTAGAVRKTAANGSINCGGEFGLIPDGKDFTLKWKVKQHSASTSMSGACVMSGSTPSYPLGYPNFSPSMMRYSIFHLTNSFYRDDQNNTTGSTFSTWAVNSVFEIRRVSNVTTGWHNNAQFTTYTTPHNGDLRVLFFVRDTPNTAINQIEEIELTIYP